MEEIWKEIDGYEGYFEVSNLGNFRSKDRIIRYKQNGMRLYPGKSLKTDSGVEGYQRITLMKEGIKQRYMCHRLVAQMFIPNPENKPFVNHINGIKYDNRACNLEWCTQSENEIHSVKYLGNTMKGKTYPKRVWLIEGDKSIMFDSISKLLEYIGCGCIEGVNKAIRANRTYHGYKLSFQNPK